VAVDRARRGEGPWLGAGRTPRLTAHSSDDDDRTYRDRAEIEAQKRQDPVPRLAEKLRERGLLDDEMIAQVEQEAMAEIDRALEEALRAPYPQPEDALHGVFEEGSVGDRYVRSWRAPGS
jgi:2-oxoisovalerate dehydrogenase E1 component alpha subunit